MKKAILLFAFALAFTTIKAQIQNGVVREQNSNKEPIAGAQITFTDAVPTSSDQLGNFRLAFSGKKAGDLIFFTEITKKGYEIVNEKELQVLKIGNANQLGKDIILAKSGVLDAAKKEYYDISDKALLASFNKEKNALQEQLKNVQLTQQAYLLKFDTLYNQFEQQQKALDALADVFARVNFDDVSEEYKKAFDLFELGRIDEALKILESTDLLNRTAKRLKEKKRLEAAGANIAQQKAENEKEIREDLQGMQLQAQLYVLTFQVEKAERLYDQILRLDTTDLEILSVAADFYRTNHRYDKALRTYPLVVAHPKAEAWQVAKAHGNMGEMLTATGNLPAALDAYTQSFEAYEKLHRGKPEDAFYKDNLAVSYQFLGATHTALGNLDKALTFFEDYNKLEKELYAAYPTNVDFKHNLAISYSKLGDTHTTLGNLDKALAFFEDYNKLEKELYAAYPKNVAFKKGLAISYAKLGGLNAIRKEWDKAKIYYDDYYQLVFELNTAYPTNVNFINGVAISHAKLGMTVLALGDITTAHKEFAISKSLFGKLYKDTPSSIYFQANYAQATAVSKAIEIIAKKEINTAEIMEGKAIFDKINSQSKNLDYQKRAAIIEKMLQPGSDLNALVIEISMFTL